jgi:hypothetical protein
VPCLNATLARNRALLHRWHMHCMPLTLGCAQGACTPSSGQASRTGSATRWWHLSSTSQAGGCSCTSNMQNKGSHQQPWLLQPQHEGAICDLSLSLTGQVGQPCNRRRQACAEPHNHNTQPMQAQRSIDINRRKRKHTSPYPACQSTPCDTMSTRTHPQVQHSC